MTRKEIVLAYSQDDLLKHLELPNDSVILSVYEQTVFANPRNFCFRISVDEKGLDKYLKKIITVKKKGDK